MKGFIDENGSIMKGFDNKNGSITPGMVDKKSMESLNDINSNTKIWLVKEKEKKKKKKKKKEKKKNIKGFYSKERHENISIRGYADKNDIMEGFVDKTHSIMKGFVYENRSTMKGLVHIIF